MTFFSELRRRKVFRVAAVYAATAFVVLQAADIILPRVGVPDWVMSLVVVLTVLGFPIALVLAWALELTPEGGIERTGAATGETGESRALDDEPRADDPPLFGRRTLVAVSLLAVLGVGLGAGWFLRPASDRAPDTTTALGQPVERSIAVLPFADLSPERDQAYFSDGLAEEILNLLAAVRDLSVASRTSAFSFRGSGLPIPEIAGRLGVHYILEGSVRKAGDRIRVTAQLIDARADRHLWSEHYDRDLADVFAVQDEIAASIGDALEVELLGRDGGTVTATEIAPELYERFLQSRFLLRQRNQAAIGRATALLEQVVEGEPDYAPGLAQLAEAHMVSGETSDAEALRARLDLIQELVERALTIDPSLVGAHAVRGNVAVIGGDYRTALDDYERAVDLDPDDPRSHHWRALLYADAGYLDRAERAIAESLRLDPDNANAQGWRGHLMAARGDWQGALQARRRQAALGNPYGHVATAVTLLAIDPERNLEAADAELRLAAANGARPREIPLESIAIARGEEAALDTLLEKATSDRVTLYSAGMALMALDRPQALLKLLEHDDYLYGRLGPTVWSTEHAPMRRDPRFVEFLERRGVVDLWREIGPPPDCVRDGDTFRCGLHGEETN